MSNNLSRQQLNKLAMHELRAHAKMLSIAFSSKNTKNQLIEAILDPSKPIAAAPESVKTVQPGVPDRTDLFTKDQVEQLLMGFQKTMEEAQNMTIQQLNLRISELEQKSAHQDPVLAGEVKAEGLSAKDVLELFAKQLKRDTDEKTGMALPGVPSKGDVLTERVIFWTRSPQFHMSNLRIGPVPEQLPRGYKKIVFERVYGPVTYVDPNYPMPRVVCMTRYVTTDRLLVEKMRLDARYGAEFFEDFKEAARLDDAGEEYRRAYEGHKLTIRANPDPNHIFRLAKEEGIEFGINSSPEKLLHQVSSRYATREAAKALQGQQKLMAEKARMAGLAQQDNIPIPQ